MLDTLSKKIINNFQGGFPITIEPFVDAAKQLDIDEKTLLDKIEFLLQHGFLSRFGPLFNADKIGGAFTLAALQVPEKQFESVTKIVNSYPEVAHNYRRNHRLNMWFVLASDKKNKIQYVLDDIENKTQLTVYNFPKTQEFYVGLYLHLDEQCRVHTKSATNQYTNENFDIDSIDRKIIKATQAGLPLLERPYNFIAKQVNTDEDAVIKRLDKMLECGIIRRIGVVPNHYKLGLTGNGMSVWDVPDEMVSELGEKIGALDFVSHAYQRPRHLPLWRYNLFAMVHGQDKNEVKQKVKTIFEILGKNCKQHEILFSLDILKKTGMRLIT